MPQLHETIMGKRLIEHTLPEIAEQLQKIAEALEKANKLKEEELSYKKILHDCGPM